MNMKATVYNTQGKETTAFEMPESVFNQKWNADLMHEVVVSMMSNARASIASTKGRGAVRGGGKKPWRQKGTGRARHGSSRSPIWRGGGVTHGPLAARSYVKKINRSARAKALGIALSKKFADGEIVLVDTFNFTAPKAKDARAALVSLSAIPNAATLKSKRKNAALIVIPTRSAAIEKSFQNFGNVVVAQAKDINPVEILTNKYVLIVEPGTSIETLLTRVQGKKAVTAAKQ